MKSVQHNLQKYSANQNGLKYNENWRRKREKEIFPYYIWKPFCHNLWDCKWSQEQVQIYFGTFLQN